MCVPGRYDFELMQWPRKEKWANTRARSVREPSAVPGPWLMGSLRVGSCGTPTTTLATKRDITSINKSVTRLVPLVLSVQNINDLTKCSFSGTRVWRILQWFIDLHLHRWFWQVSYRMQLVSRKPVRKKKKDRFRGLKICIKSAGDLNVLIY